MVGQGLAVAAVGVDARLHVHAPGLQRLGQQQGVLHGDTGVVGSVPEKKGRRAAPCLSDREAEPVALRFAGLGYAAFVLRYRVAPRGLWPLPQRQLLAAIDYVRTHASSAVCQRKKGGAPRRTRFSRETVSASSSTRSPTAARPHHLPRRRLPLPL